LAVLIHFFSGEQCSVTALDLSGNPLHAISNFGDLLVALAHPSSSVCIIIIIIL
jgi:hypothetical protein